MKGAENPMYTIFPGDLCGKKIGSLSLIAVLLIALCSCSGRQDGEAWAKLQLGSEQAEKLRQEILGKLELGFSGGKVVTLPKPGKSPYLPHPYVIFELQRDRRDPNRFVLNYSSLNSAVNFTAGSPRGVAVLQKDTRSTGRDRKGRVNLEVFTQVEILDLEANIMTMTQVTGAEEEKTRKALESLPSSAP